MVELGGFDILGHADKMHYNASCYRPGLLDEPWYDALVRDYFAEIARHGYIVEINTKSYHDLGTFYPNERYFPLLKELGIRCDEYTKRKCGRDYLLWIVCLAAQRTGKLWDCRE